MSDPKRTALLLGLYDHQTETFNRAFEEAKEFAYKYGRAIRRLKREHELAVVAREIIAAQIPEEEGSMSTPYDLDELLVTIDRDRLLGEAE